MLNNENDQPLEIAVEIFAKPNLLSQAFIETPCESSWDKMTGNDSVRFCGQCSLNVYNVANLTDKEAEAVFAKGREQGRVCARLYRRPDGTIMTDNCPRSLRKIRDASRWLKTKIVAGFALTLSLFTPAQAEESKKVQAKDLTPKEGKKFTLGDVYVPPKAEPLPVKMGEVYVPPKSTKVTSATNGSTSSGQATSTPGTAPNNSKGVKAVPDQSAMAGGLSFRPDDFTSYKNEITNSLQLKWKAKGISAPFPKVQFKIDEQGKVSALKIVTSSGNKETDSVALKAISAAAPFPRPPLGASLPYEVQVGAGAQ
ncbi:TonB C-terminal domain-containing protein [bacterium]|nr:TonB C-terminal domain-containing protein [bacterium]